MQSVLGSNLHQVFATVSEHNYIKLNPKELDGYRVSLLHFGG